MDQTKNKIKILLVDDDEMMRIYFRDVFWIHSNGDIYNVATVSSLKEAEKIVEDETTRPDIIFLDLMIPVRGEDNSPDGQMERGISFIEKVKSITTTAPIKVIIFSSQKEDCIKNEACKLGVQGYLVKGELMPKEIIDFTDKIHESNN